MWTRTRDQRQLRGWSRFVAGLLSLALMLAAGGCAEKVAGPGTITPVKVTTGLKSILAGRFILTVTGPDMEAVTSPPTETPVFNLPGVPIGKDRRFVVEALDAKDTVIYRGGTTADVVSLVPVDLTISMLPVVPLVYLNPHAADVPLGSDFAVTINVHDLPGLSGAGISMNLFGDDVYGMGEFVSIVDVVLAPAQIAAGSSLSYDNYSFGYIDITVTNEDPIVDENGDGALVIIHCRTQDTWPGEPVEFVPTMYLQNLAGYQQPVGSVYVDTARYRLVRERIPESFLGSPFDDSGVALVPLGGGEAMLAAVWSDNADMTPPLYLARLGATSTPLSEYWLTWPDGQAATGMARAVGGGYFVSRTSPWEAGSVVRVNDTGTAVWFEDLYDFSFGRPNAIAARSGGGCVAAGTWSNDGLHFYLAAFDADGYQQHYAPTDFSRDQEFQGVVALDDTTFAAVGYEQPFSGTRDAVLAKYSLRRNFVERWFRRYGGPGDESFYDMLALADGGFMMVGAVRAVGGGLGDLYAVRTDRDGSVRWTSQFGTGDFDEAGFCVCGTPDGAFVAAGSASGMRQNRDVYVVKFDGSGDLVWSSTLGGTGDDVARDIIPMGNGYLLTGSSSSGPLGGSDILILRLGSDGKRMAD